MRRKAKRWIADQLGITRLDQAVSYLFARDVNLLSSAQPGPDGNANLRDASTRCWRSFVQRCFAMWAPTMAQRR
jgi:hypothetical protein